MKFCKSIKNIFNPKIEHKNDGLTHINYIDINGNPIIMIRKYCSIKTLNKTLVKFIRMYLGTSEFQDRMNYLKTNKLWIKK